VADDSWLGAYGHPLARWGDEKAVCGPKTYFRGVVYEDGVKIDYSIWPLALLDHVSAEGLIDDLDVGYRVLLDKDGRTSGWPAPTYRAHIPSPPTKAEYDALVDEFWWSTTYVAKALWREEVVFAKLALDDDVKFALRKMLEWRIEIDHGWTLRPGAYGRGLERLLPAGLWSELSATYVGAGVEENWDALFRAIDLFRRVAGEVAAALGHPYSHEQDATATALLHEMHALPR
jgi:aminoglycoside 6-adenylyltransferase